MENSNLKLADSTPSHRPNGATKHLRSAPQHFSEVMNAIDALSHVATIFLEGIKAHPVATPAKAMTPAEAAKALSISRNTLDAMVNNGTLREGYHFFQHGTMRRYHPDLIGRLMDGTFPPPDTLNNVSPPSPSRKHGKKTKQGRRKPLAGSVVNAAY